MLRLLEENDSVMSSFLHRCEDIIMILTPSIGYFLQADKFKKTKSSKGFSKLICLILLIAHILRIYFWFGKNFTIVLLFQSFVLIISQCYLLHASIIYGENANLLPQYEDAKYTKAFNVGKILGSLSFKRTFNSAEFWNWPEEIEYYKFLFVFTFASYLLVKIIGLDKEFFVSFIGFLSVSCETVIGIPQVIENYKIKNTNNISTVMILFWLVGDIYKVGYYIKVGSPSQFVIGGSLQVLLDVTLTMQIIIYSQNKFKDKKYDDELKGIKAKPINDESSNKNDENTLKVKEGNFEHKEDGDMNEAEIEQSSE